MVVDGLDGCGKDTHADRIRRVLEARGERVAIVTHPSKRFFGRLSKKALEGSGAMARLFATVFFTMDVLSSVRLLKKERNGTVIFVRYLLGTAYLPARIAPAGYHVFRTLLPFPDMAFFIDIDPEVALRRIRLRGDTPEMFETKSKLESVRRIARRLTEDEWIRIDNSIDGEAPLVEMERVLLQRISA